jgi:predicted nuclease with TOPRIM domain
MHWKVGRGSNESTPEQVKRITERFDQLNIENATLRNAVDSLQKHIDDVQKRNDELEQQDAARLTQLETENAQMQATIKALLHARG